MTHAEIQKLRELTAAQMTCACGDLLAITSMGLVCCNLDCTGERTRDVFINNRAVSVGKLSEAWPERVVKHEKRLPTRLKEFSEGLEKLA